MGLAGQYLAKSAIFLGSAVLCIPALIALFMIRSDEIDYARARNAGSGKQAKSFQRLFDLGKNRTLYIFAGCVFLFQLADASMLPVVGQDLAQGRSESASLLMAGLIVVPQILVALALAVGWILFRKVGAQAAPACRLRTGNCPGGPVCVLYRLYRAHRWSIAWWNQRSGRDGGHGSGHHRPHDGNRALQFGARLHRDGNRCCRLGQYHRDRVYFSDVWPLGGVL